MYIASLLFTSSYLSPPFLLTALQAITRDPGTLFSTAVSIAPIVNWISSKRYVTYVLLRRTHPLPLSLRPALLSTTRGRFLCASLSFALLADADHGHTHTTHTHITRYHATLVTRRRDTGRPSFQFDVEASFPRMWRSLSTGPLGDAAGAPGRDDKIRERQLVAYRASPISEIHNLAAVAANARATNVSPPRLLLVQGDSDEEVITHAFLSQRHVLPFSYGRHTSPSHAMSPHFTSLGTHAGPLRGDDRLCPRASTRWI